jgi:hypothetical protein
MESHGEGGAAGNSFREGGAAPPLSGGVTSPRCLTSVFRAGMAAAAIDAAVVDLPGRARADCISDHRLAVLLPRNSTVRTGNAPLRLTTLTARKVARAARS